MSPPETAEERAARRAAWPARRGTSQEPAAGPEDPTAAWNAVLELTYECYRLAGHDLSPLPRDRWPVRLFRPGEPRRDADDAG
ncbi:MAG TPA: hypothetical protein VMB50_06340 [Myxococcales bacterium]|nr:hypothetical protein [Myxococcales bacterium]